MSLEPEADSTEDNLERFDVQAQGPTRTISASLSGVWWTDSRTDREGQLEVDIRYLPGEWIVYPDTLAQYLRSVTEAEARRPEPLATMMWTELAHLLYEEEAEAKEKLELVLSAETPMDDYLITVGEVVLS